MIGIDPLPHRLRDLVGMARARRIEAWDHTAALMANIANCTLRPRRPILATDLHPLRRTRRPSVAEAVATLGPADPSRYLPVSLRITPPDTPQEPAP